jgi:hypothetical protein
MHRNGSANHWRQEEEMSMNRDVLCVSNAKRQGATAGCPGSGRIGMMVGAALYSTSIWWGVLHFGGRGMGLAFDDATLMLVLSAIFLVALLVLGLSMGGIAESDAPSQPAVRRRYPVAT